jgi:hypothetical protein
VGDFVGRCSTHGFAWPGSPGWLVVDPSCTYLRRTLPAQIQDKHDPDDMDTSGDDHGCDSIRYGAMSRPSPTRIDTSPKPFPVNSWGWWREHHEREARGNGVLG